MKTLNKIKCVVATIKSWNVEEAKRFITNHRGLKVILITNEQELTYQKTKSFNPRYIFFPHWSWIIPNEIYKNFECVVFHMTDLPFGRGGSPLQNLIARGIYKTKLTALRAVKEMDAGPIYLKRNLNLTSSATEIFKRAAKIIFRDMIPYIVKYHPQPVPQKGRVIVFKRRMPDQSNIKNLKSLQKIYDYIRMLDVEGYPPAFIESVNLRVEFNNAKLKNNYVFANAKIRIKK